MGIETILLICGVLFAIGISVVVAKSGRKFRTVDDDSDPGVDPPAPPARRPRT